MRLEVSAPAQGVPFDPDRLHHPSCLRAPWRAAHGGVAERASRTGIAGEIVSKVLQVASMTCIDGGESFAEKGWMPVYLSSAWAGAVSRAPWLPKLA